MKDESSTRSEREINPCPFCAATWQSGGLGVGYVGQPARGWHVSCVRCKATGPYVDGGSTESIPLAIDLWNKAAPVSERGTSVAELQRAFREERVKQTSYLSYSSANAGEAPIRVWDITFTDATVKKLSGERNER